MKKTILFGLILISLFLISGCNQDLNNAITQEKEKISKTPAEELKFELENEGYLIYLIKANSNNQGSYINIIYKDTNNRGLVDEIKLREFTLHHFPNKDYYVISNIRKGIGSSTYLATNKEDAIHIINGEDLGSLDGDSYFEAFETEINGWLNKSTVADSMPRRNLKFQLSEEEFYFLEFRYKDELKEALRNANEDICWTLTKEKFNLDKEDIGKWDELIFTELFYLEGGITEEEFKRYEKTVSDKILEAREYSLECSKLAKEMGID